MNFKEDSHRASAWQANLPSMISVLADKWQEAANISINQSQQVPKKLTTEALCVLCGILLFVIPSVIGSAINAFESFCGASPKKKSSTNGKDQRNDANGETNSTTEKEEDESSTISVWSGSSRKFFDCFCVQTNARKILSTSSNHGYLDCIDGIRAIIFLWIFIAHFFFFYVRSIKNLNKHIKVILEMPITIVGANAVFGIDTFIILSGFLTGYLFFDYYEKHNGKIPWILFYAIRFLRVTPLYLVVLGFYSTLFTYISSSPVWPTYNTNPVCRESWIWNVFYINNFLTHYKQCLNMTWFLACVMQLYVISPLFMIPLKRWPRFGHVLSVVTICISCYATFIITKKHNIFATFPKITNETNAIEEINKRMWQFGDELYMKPYIKLTPYLVGMLLGYNLHNRNLSKKDSWLTLSFGWIMFAFLLWICFFAFDGRDESLWETAVYNGVKTLLFSLAFSWLIFVFTTQQGGSFGKFFSRPIFKPISRLSFSAYLTQIIVFEWNFLSYEVFVSESLFYESIFSDLSWALLLGRMFLWTLVTAFAVSLLFEYPVIRLLHTYLAGKEKTS
ncbi:nose resistant to fluoxetine protein 6-like [Argiope bruennichi]|uniref:nose resistant to fluoxetine protein 6-like n=1 Tax=Argiope bruennichi TaxID=94029 RepID=UPI0024942BF2|nr:nose resistant to fluoxetine protein 6-like [Argiope bruennichi]